MNLTYIIIGLTSVVSLMSFNKPQIMNRFMFNPYAINHNNEYYRFLTSGLLHGSIGHLALNMLTMYFFGGIVEMYFSYIFGASGAYYFVALYTLGVIVADIPTYFKQRNNPSYNALGASGGVASVLFVSIVLQPMQKICLYFFICLPGVILGIGYLIYSYFSGKKANDHINHDAHLYGALFGLVYCVVMVPHAIPNFIDQIANW